MDRRNFLKTLWLGLAQWASISTSLPVQKLISSSLCSVNRVHNLPDIKQVITKDIMSFLDVSCAWTDMQKIYESTSFFQKILRMVDIMDELKWMWFSSISSPEFDLSFWNMDDTESYIAKLNQQYENIFPKFQNSLDNIDIGNFDLSAFYSSSMGSFQDNEVFHNYSWYENMSSDYDESRKILIIYDGCDDDWGIPEWADILYEIPLDEIINEDHNIKIIQKWTEIINDIKRAYKILKQIELMKSKLKKIHSFESTRHNKNITVKNVIWTYQRKMINYYINLCFTKEEIIDPMKFITLLQGKIEHKEDLWNLSWISVHKKEEEYFIFQWEEELFNGPIVSEVIFTDKFISLLHENSNIVKHEWEQQEELIKSA